MEHTERTTISGLNCINMIPHHTPVTPFELEAVGVGKLASLVLVWLAIKDNILPIETRIEHGWCTESQ